VVWDRFDTELGKAGFKPQQVGPGRAVPRHGRRADRQRYQSRSRRAARSGRPFSKIIAEDVDVVISVPVLKTTTWPV